MNHGIAFVTDDRKNSGNLNKVSAKENATISILPRLKRFLLIDNKKNGRASMTMWTSLRSNAKRTS